MTRIPCAHANPEDYVDDYYTTKMYKNTYEEIVYLVPSEDQWIKKNYDKVNPPVYKIPLGRPKILRTRALEEPKNPYRIRKGGVRNEVLQMQRIWAQHKNISPKKEKCSKL